MKNFNINKAVLAPEESASGLGKAPALNFADLMNLFIKTLGLAAK